MPVLSASISDHKVLRRHDTVALRYNFFAHADGNAHSDDCKKTIKANFAVQSNLEGTL